MRGYVSSWSVPKGRVDTHSGHRSFERLREREFHGSDCWFRHRDRTRAHPRSWRCRLSHRQNTLVPVSSRENKIDETHHFHRSGSCRRSRSILRFVRIRDHRERHFQLRLEVIKNQSVPACERVRNLRSPTHRSCRFFLSYDIHDHIRSSRRRLELGWSLRRGRGRSIYSNPNN